MGKLHSMQGRKRQAPTGVATVRPNDPWVEVHNVTGWEAWTFQVRTEIVDGEPKLVGVRIEPREDKPTKATVIDRRQGEKLPTGELALYGLLAHDSDRLAMVDRFVTFGDPPPRPVGGSDEFSAYVADVYRSARAAGGSGQKAVAEACGLSVRSAENYIKEARQRGQLEPAQPRKKGQQ